MTDIASPERLREVAQEVRGSLNLGRSNALHRLFDYILERSLKGETIKEVDVASEVLGKPSSDLLVDASARVYIHRLRKKLDDYYSGPGQDERERLALPKGEYRFELASNQPSEAEDAPEPLEEVGPSRRNWAIGLLAMLSLGLVLGASIALFLSNAETFTGDQRAARKTDLWSPLLSDARPLAIVPGDYYIFGERDAPGEEPSRLVREFSINSREELDEVIMFDPKLRERYVDLDLHYLPVSTASALKSITALLGSQVLDRRGTRMIASSDLQPPELRNSDIVYVGLLSGLGLLQQAVFGDSRFGFGGSFDELIDTKTGKVYVSEPPRDAQTPRRNFAYIASLPGPNGNRVLVLAGTRDAALLEAVDIATSREGAEELSKVSKDGYFEALYAVDGLGAENLKGTLIAAEPRKTTGIWDAMSEPAGQDAGR